MNVKKANEIEDFLVLNGFSRKKAMKLISLLFVFLLEKNYSIVEYETILQHTDTF